MASTIEVAKALRDDNFSLASKKAKTSYDWLLIHVYCANHKKGIEKKSIALTFDAIAKKAVVKMFELASSFTAFEDIYRLTRLKRLKNKAIEGMKRTKHRCGQGIPQKA